MTSALESSVLPSVVRLAMVWVHGLELQSGAASVSLWEADVDDVEIN